MAFIEDGEGDGRRAGVTDQNRLKADAISEDKFLELTAQGRGFILTTGVIDLTSSNASGIIVFTNDGSADIILSEYTIASTKSQELSGTPNTQSSIRLDIVSAITANDLPNAITPVAANDEGITADVTIVGGVEGSVVVYTLF